jgi:hypothetical protein
MLSVCSTTGDPAPVLPRYSCHRAASVHISRTDAIETSVICWAVQRALRSRVSGELHRVNILWNQGASPKNGNGSRCRFRSQQSRVFRLWWRNYRAHNFVFACVHQNLLRIPNPCSAYMTRARHGCSAQLRSSGTIKVVQLLQRRAIELPSTCAAVV